jgi:hypothetical protein
MNSAHLHLLLNRIPILGSACGLALLAWGVLRRSESSSRVGLATLVVAGLMGSTSLLGGLIRHAEIRSDTIDRAVAARSR